MMSCQKKRVAVVTGGNKGIGLATVRAICKSFDGVVYLAARNSALGQKAVEELKKEGLNPVFQQLDIDSLESIQRFRDFIKKKHGGLDVLVNNAGILYMPGAPEPFAEQAEVTIRVNVFGTLNVCNELFPLLRKNGRVVNVTSAAGRLPMMTGKEPEATKLRKEFSDPHLTTSRVVELMNCFVNSAKQGTHVENGWPNGDYAAYIVSKVGISALNEIQQREMDKERPIANILINAVYPGYVSSELNNHTGVMTTEEGAVTPTWAALLPPEISAPRGEFIWHNKERISWIDGPTPTPY